MFTTYPRRIIMGAAAFIFLAKIVIPAIIVVLDDSSWNRKKKD